jgi:hypothetical protein
MPTVTNSIDGDLWLGYESFGKFWELIAINQNVSELPELRQAMWRVQITSKNRYKLEEVLD